MANFNPGLNTTGDPNYDGAARPLHIDVNGMGSNRREQTLFDIHGISKGVGQAIQGGYNTIKSGIEDAVYNGVDPLRDAQGVGAAVLGTEDQASQAAGNKPADPEFMKDSISRVHAAYEQGKISDTNYYAQLEAMTRSIRSRFPGFREEVDAMVHSVTGITPANALRSSILHDLNNASQAQDALAKEFRHFETNNSQYLPSDYYVRKQSGKPYSPEETYAYVGAQKQQEHGVQQAKAGIELKAAQNKLTDEEAETAARDGTSAVHTRVMSQLGPFFQEINDRMKAGKTFSPEEQQLITAKFNEYKSAAQKAYDQYFDSPLSPNSTRTMGGLVKDKRAGIIADHMKIFDTLEKNLFDPKSGVLEAAANEAKAITDSKSLSIMQKYPVIAEVGALVKVYGPAAGQILDFSKIDASLSQKLTAPVVEILKGQGLSTIQGKSNSDQELNDLLSTPQGKTPAAVKAWVDSKAAILSNTSLNNEHLENAAKAIFGADPMGSKLMGRFNEGSQQELFQRLASPQVVANMKRVGGTTWENYSAWAQNAFVTTIRSAAAGVGQSPDSPYWKVSFNDKTSKFELSPTPEGIKFLNNKRPMEIGNWTGRTTIDLLSKFIGSDVKSQIDKINRNIDYVKPVLEANGHTASEEIKKLTSFMSQYDQKNQNVWQFLMQNFNVSPDDKAKKEDVTFGGVHPNFTQASGGNSGGLSLTDLAEEHPTKAMDALKTSFAQGESGGNYNRLVDTPTHPKEINLTEMSIGDVLAYQKGMLNAGNKSSAAGKYQIVSKTLKSLVDEGVVTKDDLYNEKTQEKLADALLERRGLSDYLDGNISLNKFMKNLGEEWEIIKRSPAAYHKVMFELERMRTKVASD